MVDHRYCNIVHHPLHMMHCDTVHHPPHMMHCDTVHHPPHMMYCDIAHIEMNAILLKAKINVTHVNPWCVAEIVIFYSVSNN